MLSFLDYLREAEIILNPPANNTSGVAIAEIPLQSKNNKNKKKSVIIKQPISNDNKENAKVD